MTTTLQRLVRTAKPLVPVAVVLFALSALVVQAVVLEHEMDALRQEIGDILDPARRNVRELQYFLGQETAGTRGFLLTGDSAYARRHQEARRQRQAVTEQLRLLSERAPDSVRLAVKSLVAQLRPADRALDSLYSGQISREAYVARLGVQQQRFEEITATTRGIGILLSRIAGARVVGLDKLQRRAMLATFVLAALAALAALLVLELGLAYRRLAEREALARAESEGARASSEVARAEADERRAETERIAASRERLVRGFTHDVKNPLGAAAGCLELADEGLMDMRDGMRRARRSVEAALRLIDDLLQLARVEAGGMLVRHEPVNIGAVASEIIEEWSGIAEAKGLALTTELTAGEMVILSDAEKVRQIVGNLVSNAVRYTAAGSVTVRVSTEEASSGEAVPSVCIEVRDTGPGISPEQCSLLFEEFRRLDSAGGTKGYGLGLAISSRLATALGGRITVESTLGEGSRFCLWLPRESLLPSLPAGVSEALSVAHPPGVSGQTIE